MPRIEDSVIVSRSQPDGSDGPNETDRPYAVVWLRGEHDISNASELSTALDHIVTLDRGDVVVDLSEVRFMSAATVGVIIRGRRALRLASRSLVIRSPSRCAARVLELCGVAVLAPAIAPRVNALARHRGS